MTRPPWSPTGIALLTLVFSPVVGAVLHAIDYSRLGIPQRRRVALFSNLSTATLVLWSAARGSTGAGWRLGVALLPAAYFYKTQAGLFAAHRAGGGARASLWLPAILLIAATLAVGLLLAALGPFA